MADKSRHTRRGFIKRATLGGAAAIGAPYFVPARVLGAQGATPPSDRIVMGIIGTGGMGRANLDMFMSQPDVQMIAACDVDKGHLDGAVEAMNGKYGNKDAKSFHDFRELLAIKDIEAVAIVTPDHWHAIAAIAAANAGKDIYCEKPLANSVGEGRAICNAVRDNKRVLQTGSMERSNPSVRKAMEIIQSGRLGKVHTLRVNLPTDEDHHKKARAITTMPPQAPVPEGFDYDFWLGHTPAVPYHESQCHFFWRFNLAWGGGEMTDRGAHIIDLGQMILGKDETGPVNYTASGVQTTGLYNTFFDFDFENQYADGVKIIGTSKTGPRGIGFEGDQGKLFVNIHGGELKADPPTLLDSPVGASTEGYILHRRNFLDCVRSRETTHASAEAGHRTATICHLNNIAMELKQSFAWDPVAEQTDNADANKLLTASMRSPWKL